MTQAAVTKTRTVITELAAPSLYAEAHCARGLWKVDQENQIQLFRGEVVENDSPGAGRSDHPDIEPFFSLEGAAELRKVLQLGKVECLGAQIAFVAIEDPDNQTTLSLVINGVEVLRPPSSQAAPDAKQYSDLPWSRWYYVDIPPETLREGPNEIRVSAVGGAKGWQLMVADYRDFSKGMEDPVVLPHSSSRSDDGATWTPERGEYVLRLLLDRYLPQGELRTPVLDVAGQEGEQIKSWRAVEQVRLNWDQVLPQSAELVMSMRSGPCPTPVAAEWSDWIACQAGVSSTAVRGRYVQLRAELSTSDPRCTPLLKSVTIEADVRTGPDQVPRVAGARNARILRSSWQMPHENPRCRQLSQLRRECELDAVIAGAQTEFESIQRLHRWAYHIPLGECSHFPWNVLGWIDLHRRDDCSIELNEYSQRRRDRMCLYPNVVLVAALQSFGLVARHLNFHSEGMTGHEICEVWSNDYGKWIHLDATRDYYWHDRRTLVPLDTGEIHRVLMDRVEGVETWERPYLYQQDLEALVQDLPITFWDGEYQHSVGAGEHGALFLFRSFCHFRIVPRFDVFSRPRPLPVSQGTEVWSWNGYLNWAEDRVPPLRHFSHHTNRRADFYPTLNQVKFTAHSSDDGGELKMTLETETPDFADFEVRLDRGPWTETEATWDWSLREGMNTAEMRTRNRSGITGVISSLAVVR
jgi:hypothetical protein